uniref:Uncharacterized protein n=1 Tax=Medicago truncatula TaxID=3880 RepID=B7FIB5_MEDTR|nr:unknown [Medicago truncatula]
MSLGIIVTRLAWIAHKLVSSKRPTRYAFSSLLQCKHSMALETKVSLEVLSNFTNQPLEWELPDQELSTLLILPNLTKSNSSRAVTMWFLNPTSSGCRLTCSLGCKLLPRCLSTSRLTSSLLGTCHL